MNVYDFDKTIYDGDSTADFYLFSLHRHKKILLLAPSLIGAFVKYYVFRRGTKTDFKQVMYRFLQYVDMNKDLPDFWDTHVGNIKDFYKKQQKKDDVIISASPEFLLAPICQRLGIQYLMASRVDPKTGVYDGINCHGEEKVRRFFEVFSDGMIDEFYSDSHSDDPLAVIAKRAYIVKKESLTDWNKA